MRTLVTRKATGLGSDLASVVGALSYAEKLGRQVVVDWRGSRYLVDRSVNLFGLLFEAPEAIAGVPFRLAQPEERDEELPQPVFHSDDWPFEDYHRDMLDYRDRPAPTIVVTRPMHHLPPHSEQRRFLREIRLVPHLLEQAQHFREIHLRAPTVGIHIRHGAGEPLLKGRDRLIESGFAGIYERCMTAIDSFRYEKAGLFLCTDSADLRAYFVERCRGLICFDSTLSRQGPLHTSATGLRGAEHALIEMWLLGCCSGLVYNPSWFSHYARVMGEFDRPPVDIDGQSRYGTMEVYQKRIARKQRKKRLGIRRLFRL